MKRTLTCVLVFILAVGLYVFWPGDEPVTQPDLAMAPAPTNPVAPQRATATKRPAVMRARALQIGETLPGWLRAPLLHGRTAEEEDETSLFVDDTCTLKGTLVVKGKPWIKVPGMRMRLTHVWLDTVIPGETSGFDDKLFLEAEAETDRLGRFQIDNVLLRKNLFLVVQRHQTVYEVIKLYELPRAGQTKELGDVFFEERGKVRGVVVDGFGKPVADLVVRAVADPYNRGASKDDVLHDARVVRAARYDTRLRRDGKRQRRSVRRRDHYLPFPSTKTRSDGSFVLADVRPGEVTLFLNGPHKHGVKDEVLTVAGQTTDIGTLVVAGGRPVTLRFISQKRSTKPLRNAAISIQPEGWPVAAETVWTDDNGECRAFVPESGMTILAKPRGHRSWRKCKRTWLSDGVTRYLIDAYGACRVRVTDTAGRDIPGAEVAVFATDQVEGANVRVGWQTGERRGGSGFFEFNRIPSLGAVEIVASAPGYAPAAHVGLGRSPRNQRFILLKLQKRLSIEVVTVDHENRLLGGVRIRALFMPPYPRTNRLRDGEHWHCLTKFRPIVLGKTGPDARLVVPGLWRGRIDLAADFPGYTQSMSPPFVPHEGARVVIKMRRLAHLDGKVLLDGAAPSRRIEIHAIPQDHFEWDREQNPFLTRHRTITAEDGTFSFHDLYVGKWELQIATPKRVEGWGLPRVWPEGEHQLVRVAAGLRVYHLMNLKRGDSKFELRGRVRVVGRPIDARLHVEVRRTESVSDELPKRPINASRVQMAAWWNAYKKAMQRRRARAAGRRQRPPWAATGEEGRAKTRALAQAPVGTDGEFVLPVDGVGTYRVTLKGMFDGRARILKTRDIEVRAEHEDNPPLVDLTVATGDVRLFLLDDSRTPLRHRVLELRLTPPKGKAGSRGGGIRFRVRSDAEGTVELRGVPAGRYVLENSYRGRDVERAQFVVTAGTFVQRYLELR